MKRKKTIENSHSVVKCNEEEIGETETMKLEKPSTEFDIEPVSVEKPKFICSVCKKNFSDKNCLKKHIKKIHDLEPEPLLQDESTNKGNAAQFKCRVCETQFAYKRNLKRHLIKYHSQGLEDEEGGNCFCNVEGCKFRSFFINALRMHLTEEHKVKIDVENKMFASKTEFDQWKEEEEKMNVCLFIKEAGKHTLINGDQRLIYQCHRSGHYSGHGFGKRSFRVKGTCKLGKRCTAGIELTVKQTGDVHEVVYYKTHIWHTPDVTHVNLSASERAYLANKLKEGASISSILESVKADKSIEGTNFCKRIHLLKRKDLVNIENTFRLNNTERHLRKQHKKGQKIDLEKIKKNVDDYGEVVSWVLESPANVYEYFTVKKLQSEKCVESCGVVCAPCNACLHMYSCTCHDYLLFGTMCQHIHSVSLSMFPVMKCKRQTTKSNTFTPPKKKRKEKSDPQIKNAVETENRESDIIHFLTKNLELQREQELQQEKMKLREKLEFFSNLWMSKIDELNESSVQELAKIIDSAMGVLNGCVTSAPPQPIVNNIQHPPDTTILHQNHIQPNNIHAADMQHNTNIQQNMQHENHNVPKQITNLNTLPVSIQDRKYEASAQYCNAMKKKRKIEESTFYRSPVVDKRPMYENMTNEHTLVADNYTNFDCNMSWQAPTISTSNTQVGKWWT